MSYQTSTRQTALRATTRSSVRDSQVFILVGLIFLLFLTLLGSTAYCIWVFLQRTDRIYSGHIYPNVYALGVNLGGMSPEKAVLALEDVAHSVEMGSVYLTDGENSWEYGWSDIGGYLDLPRMTQMAYTVGREGDWKNRLRVWFNFFDVQPLYAFDENKAKSVLLELAPDVSRPVTQPAIQLDDGQIMIIPGEPGYTMDVERTLENLRAVSLSGNQISIPLVFQTIEPTQPDTARVTAQADKLLQRQITLTAYDVLTEKTLTWILDRDEIAIWLHLVPGEDGQPTVDVNKHKIRETLTHLADLMGDGRGFRYDEAEQQIWDAFVNEQPAVNVYLTHPERTYAVQAGDTLTRISRRFGIPAGRVAELNRDIDIDHLSIGQEIRIPSQDIVTPFMPVPGKKIVVSLAEQRVRVYENGVLIWDWITSTGMSDSPTANGVFQVIEKVDNAYASQWDLWMPYFIGVYEAGGGVVNGFHELPILANGQRLWAGSLGRPASFGCIILGIPEAETLYNWAEIGVVVVIE